MTAPNVPSSRFPAGLQFFSAYDPSVALPGNATVYTCRICVPFEHYLRQAVISHTDADNVGAVTGALMVVAPAGAKAGAAVGTTLTDTDFAATSEVHTAHNIVLAAADTGAVRAANTEYHVRLVGTNAGDLIEQPTLTIGVEPTSRSRL